MKSYSFLLLLTLLSIQGKSQEKNIESNINWQDCKIYEVIYKTIELPERAKYINNTLYKNHNVQFSFTNFSDKKSIIIVHKDVDFKTIISKIIELGYETTNIKSFDFNDNLFYECYYKATFSVIGKLPNHINTNKLKRDDALYAKAKEIFIFKYPDAYNSLNNSSMTEEQKKEKEAKDKSRNK